MEFLLTVLAFALGTMLGGTALTVAYFVVISSKWGTKLIAKWTNKYISNFTEIEDELVL